MTEPMMTLLSPGCKNYILMYFLLLAFSANSEPVLRELPHCYSRTHNDGWPVTFPQELAHILWEGICIPELKTAG